MNAHTLVGAYSLSREVTPSPAQLLAQGGLYWVKRTSSSSSLLSANIYIWVLSFCFCLIPWGNLQPYWAAWLDWSYRSSPKIMFLCVLWLQRHIGFKRTVSYFSPRPIIFRATSTDYKDFQVRIYCIIADVPIFSSATLSHVTATNTLSKWLKQSMYLIIKMKKLKHHKIKKENCCHTFVRFLSIY